MLQGERVNLNYKKDSNFYQKQNSIRGNKLGNYQKDNINIDEGSVKILNSNKSKFKSIINDKIKEQ